VRSGHDRDVPRGDHGRHPQQRAGRVCADRDRPRSHPHPPDRLPVTNTSVNPARSTGATLLVGGTPLSQLWLFWVAPIIGGILGGLAYKWLGKD
jgi:hypothetical protein